MKWLYLFKSSCILGMDSQCGRFSNLLSLLDRTVMAKTKFQDDNHISS